MHKYYWKIRLMLTRLRATPGVWLSLWKLRRRGFVVKNRQLFRAGSTVPICECNRYGVPVKHTVLMGSKATSRGYGKLEP